MEQNYKITREFYSVEEENEHWFYSWKITHSLIPLRRGDGLSPPREGYSAGQEYAQNHV